MKTAKFFAIVRNAAMAWSSKTALDSWKRAALALGASGAGYSNARFFSEASERMKKLSKKTEPALGLAASEAVGAASDASHALCILCLDKSGAGVFLPLAEKAAEAAFCAFETLSAQRDSKDGANAFVFAAPYLAMASATLVFAAKSAAMDGSAKPEDIAKFVEKRAKTAADIVGECIFDKQSSLFAKAETLGNAAMALFASGDKQGASKMIDLAFEVSGHEGVMAASGATMTGACPLAPEGYPAWVLSRFLPEDLREPVHCAAP